MPPHSEDIWGELSYIVSVYFKVNFKSINTSEQLASKETVADLYSPLQHRRTLKFPTNFTGKVKQILEQCNVILGVFIESSIK